MRATFLLILPLSGALAGCVASDAGDYPSLALREGERGDASTRAPSTDGLALIDTAQPGPLVQTRIDGAAAAARAAHARFLAALPGTRQSVAAGAGAPVDSNGYAAAQIALGNLQSISADTAFAVADLDALLAQRANALRTTTEVSAARSAAAALLQEESATLDALERRLR